MTWSWELADSSGAPVDPAVLGPDGGSAAGEADNQGDAESWLGEHWRALLARGVATATLLHDEQRVYGPMALAAD